MITNSTLTNLPYLLYRVLFSLLLSTKNITLYIIYYAMGYYLEMINLSDNYYYAETFAMKWNIHNVCVGVDVGVGGWGMGELQPVNCNNFCLIPHLYFESIWSPLNDLEWALIKTLKWGVMRVSSYKYKCLFQPCGYWYRSSSMSGCRDWGKCVYGISSIRSRRYYFFTLREATVTIRGRVVYSRVASINIDSQTSLSVVTSKW